LYFIALLSSLNRPRVKNPFRRPGIGAGKYKQPNFVKETRASQGPIRLKYLKNHTSALITDPGTWHWAGEGSSPGINSLLGLDREA